MKVILDYLREHIMCLHWTLSISSFPQGPPKTPAWKTISLCSLFGVSEGLFLMSVKVWNSSLLSLGGPELTSLLLILTWLQLMV